VTITTKSKADLRRDVQGRVFGRERAQKHSSATAPPPAAAPATSFRPTRSSLPSANCWWNTSTLLARMISL